MVDMLRTFVIAMVFFAIGTIMFFTATTIKSVVINPLNASLSNALGDTDTNHIYQQGSTAISTDYDIATWFFLVAPVVFIVIQILRREQQTQSQPMDSNYYGE